MDGVDVIVSHWAVARPELDVSGLKVFGRLHRSFLVYKNRIAETFEKYDITDSGFDVLACLRRAVPDHRLTAGELAEQTLGVASSADLVDEICVGGNWLRGSEAALDTLDPSTGEVFATLHGADVEGVDVAVRTGLETAHRSGWSSMYVHERAVDDDVDSRTDGCRRCDHTLEFPDRFWAIELVADPVTREPLAPYGGTSPAMNEVVAACKTNGLLPFVSFNRIHAAPPCTVADDEVREGLAILDTALSIADRHVVG